MQVVGVGWLASLAKKGITSSTLVFDSHEPRKSEIEKMIAAKSWLQTYLVIFKA